ncbi:MAG: hypothetical protein IT373_16755 [Polyangiaceae bacterium]|nr:hypothetical protein [Polyangiaceae bacterium]
MSTSWSPGPSTAVAFAIGAFALAVSGCPGPEPQVRSGTGAGGTGASGGGAGGAAGDGGSAGAGGGSVCGNRTVEAGETCDDGNSSPCGTCTADCQAGPQSPAKDCAVGVGCAADADCKSLCAPSSHLCVASCGDGVIDGTEACDDGNADACGTCDAGCTSAGSGATCAIGSGCASDADCETGGCGPSHTCVETVRDVAMGRFSACALLGSGAVRCWGDGGFGKLGYGNANSIGSQPGQMPPPDVAVGGKVTKLAAGENHVCALLAGGAVRCWGLGLYGQLGYDGTVNVGDAAGQMPPADVNTGGGVSALAAGGTHNCAVLVNTGVVRCWGDNDAGGLGYGHTTSIGTGALLMPPGDVAIGPVAQLGLGYQFSCTLTAASNVRCWGGGYQGQLGSGNGNNLGDDPGEMPTADLPLAAPIDLLAVGATFACAHESAGGAVRCWGENLAGQLGVGNTANIGDGTVPMTQAGADVGAGTVTQLVAGERHACALMDTGVVRCWGANDHGQLGYDSTANRGDDPGEMPPPDVNVGGPVKRLAAGAFVTCAILTTGAVRCWGSNVAGQLGQGNTVNVGDGTLPMPPPDVPIL